MPPGDPKASNALIHVRDDNDLSLLKLTQRVLIQYISTLTDIGDLPYHLLHPVLMRIDSPLQLSRLESRSPHIRTDSGPVWRKFILRDFGADAIQKYTFDTHPKLNYWSQIYDLHTKDVASAQSRATERLKAQFASLKEAKGEHKTRLVNANVLPRAGRKVGGWGAGQEKAERRWDVKAGSRTKNIVQRAKREAKEMGCFYGEKSRLAVPMHRLAAGRVSESMKEKERIRAEAVAKKDVGERRTEQVAGKKRSAAELERSSSTVSSSSSMGRRTDPGPQGEPPKKIIKRKPAAANPFMPSRPQARPPVKR